MRSNYFENNPNSPDNKSKLSLPFPHRPQVAPVQEFDSSSTPEPMQSNGAPKDVLLPPEKPKVLHISLPSNNDEESEIMISQDSDVKKFTN